MKKIVLTCVLVFSACCVTLFAQKDSNLLRRKAGIFPERSGIHRFRL